MSNKAILQPFFDNLSGATATPGGGSAAAAAGAMGAALTVMVCRLTVGKKKYQAVETLMQDTLTRAEALQAELAQLVDDDSAAFDQVMAAFKLPKGSDEEKAARREAIQAATRQATLTPLATARACAGVIELARTAADNGNRNAASDAGAAALCAQAGLRAAALNVLINLPGIKDEAFVATHQAELDHILTRHTLADEVYELVKTKL